MGSTRQPDLREARIASGLTQEEASRLANVSRRTIQRWERRREGSVALYRALLALGARRSRAGSRERS